MDGATLPMSSSSALHYAPVMIDESEEDEGERRPVPATSPPSRRWLCLAVLCWMSSLCLSFAGGLALREVVHSLCTDCSFPLLPLAPSASSAASSDPSPSPLCPLTTSPPLSTSCPSPPPCSACPPPPSPPPPCPSVPPSAEVVCPSVHSSTVPAVLDFCQSEVPYPVSVPAAVLRYCNAAVPSHFPYVSASGGRYSEKDLAMSILTVDRYKLDRDEATLLTWASPLRLPFGFLGVPSSVPRPAELLQPQLVIPETNDLFVSNLNKTFIALRELYRLYPDKPWFMQGSDDAYIDVQTLLLRLDELDSSDVLYVGGARNTAFCPTANASVTYIGGGLGFIVSNGFMKRYAEDIEPWMVREWGSEEMTGPRIFGDLMVGCFAHAHHVNVTHILGGHGEIPNAASMAWDEYPYDNGRWWGMHHINPPALLDIHLYMDLQRVDQLIVNEEWSALGNFSRILALEHHINAHRKLSLLESLKEDPSLLLDKVA